MPDPLRGESLALQDFLTNPANKIIARLGQTRVPFQTAPTLLVDLVECDFVGYAPIVSPAFNVFQNDDDLTGEALSDPLRFTAGALTAKQTANCLYLTVQMGSNPVQLWKIFPLLDPWIFDVPTRTYATNIRLYSLAEELPTPTIGE